MPIWSTLIPVIVPIVIAIGKTLLPRVPTVWLPVVAPLLGALAEIVGYAAGLTPGNAGLGAVLGAAGVGLREIVDQARKAAA